MPDFYAPGEYDLAGFIVGLVGRSRIVDGSAVRSGDSLVGIASSGLHTNGYTLARKIVFEVMGLGVEDELPGTGRSVGEELLTVHRSYLRVFEGLLAEGRIRALAHVTGGGIPGNLPRVLPDGLGATLERGSWAVPPVFDTLRAAGGVPPEEMDRVFNMGVGIIAVVPDAEVDRVVRAAAGRDMEGWAIGRVEEGEGVEYR